MRALFSVCVLSILTLSACVSTYPLYDPVYPAASTDVSYTLEARSSAGIRNVRLYETIDVIDGTGTVTSGTETLLEEWEFPNEPFNVAVDFDKSGGYSASRLVTFRFSVKSGRWWWGGRSTRSHPVTFAVRPYPVANQPAPIYVQGDVDYVFDVIFIPDTDITNMNTFRGHCRSMIRDAVMAEPSIQTWNRFFNFYINPESGTATDYDNISTDGTHQLPSNWSNISFAEAKVLMHQNSLRDYATGGVFSTEQQNRGTMMHEGGHALFGLADEYSGGVHWEASVLPNNWDDLGDAQADAPQRNKLATNAREIGSTGWYKICDNSCQMNRSGLVRNDYDDPCAGRVVNSIIQNATTP